MALPIGSLIVASGHHPDLRVVYAIDESAGGDAVVANPAITGIAELRGKVIGTTWAVLASSSSSACWRPGG